MPRLERQKCAFGLFQEIEAEKKEAEEAKKKNKKEGLFGFLYRDQTPNKGEDVGSMEFSLAGLFKCMCCVQPKPNQDHHRLINIENSLDVLKAHLLTQDT